MSSGRDRYMVGTIMKAVDRIVKYRGEERNGVFSSIEFGNCFGLARTWRVQFELFHSVEFCIISTELTESV